MHKHVATPPEARRTGRRNNFLLVAGTALLLAGLVAKCGIKEELEQTSKPTIAYEFPKKDKPEYQTKAKWKEQQGRKILYDFFKMLLKVKMPEPQKINHPLDAYSCIMDARVQAFEAQTNAEFFDEDRYLKANGCPTMPELLDEIKKNPTPESLDALRRLALARSDYFDAKIAYFAYTDKQTPYELRLDALGCSMYLARMSFINESSAIMAVAELAVSNQTAFEILTEAAGKGEGVITDFALMLRIAPQDEAMFSLRSRFADATRIAVRMTGLGEFSSNAYSTFVLSNFEVDSTRQDVERERKYCDQLNSEDKLVLGLKP
ncbi:MAG: hypothetical protein Q7S22_03270 [Candidatus Micrarchaeota archaeon]|nr:hypothetical protein [Candidatus Micrarchaeota archaeon]